MAQTQAATSPDSGENLTMKIASSEREILKLLYSSNEWADLYSLHDKYLLSPGQLSNAVRKFEDAGIIESKELEVKLTLKGRVWLIKHRRAIFMGGHGRPWAKPRPEHCQEPISPMQPYLPELENVDQAFFLRK